MIHTLQLHSVSDSMCLFIYNKCEISWLSAIRASHKVFIPRSFNVLPFHFWLIGRELNWSRETLTRYELPLFFIFKYLQVWTMVGYLFLPAVSCVLFPSKEQLSSDFWKKCKITLNWQERKRKMCISSVSCQSLKIASIVALSLSLVGLVLTIASHLVIRYVIKLPCAAAWLLGTAHFPADFIFFENLLTGAVNVIVQLGRGLFFWSSPSIITKVVSDIFLLWGSHIYDIDCCYCCKDVCFRQNWGSQSRYFSACTRFPIKLTKHINFLQNYHLWKGPLTKTSVHGCREYFLLVLLSACLSNLQDPRDAWKWRSICLKSVDSCGKPSDRVEHCFAGRTTTLWKWRSQISPDKVPLAQHWLRFLVENVC